VCTILGVARRSGEDRRTNSEAVAHSLSWRSKKVSVPCAGGQRESVLTPNDTSPNEVL